MFHIIFQSLELVTEAKKSTGDAETRLDNYVTKEQTNQPMQA